MTTADAGDRYIVSSAETNLRSGPSTSCDIVAELERDTALVVVGDLVDGDDYSWAPVSSESGEGFVVVANIQEVPDGVTCVKAEARAETGEDGFTSDAVNLRSGPGLGCAIIAQLNSGTPVQVRGKSIEGDGEIWLPVSSPMGDGYIVHDAYAPPGSWEQPVAVAVLMYHDLNDNYNRFVVAPWQLEQQLIWLRDNGYTSITPRDLVAFLDTGAPLPPRPVILSVDDGWASARVFRDLLTAYGFKGTYMLPNYAELTPEEIYDLNQNGEVCGHSVSHPFLDQLGYDGQWYEIVENKAWLDAIIGTSATCFAYPFGAFNDTTTQIVIDAGYQVAFHAWDGLQYFEYMDRWHITRIEVSGDWDLSTFAAVVTF
ncbi:MAG: SH3 domain-containing protein [Thermomicrobiales bacterium]|nr:SH3 domain-containing protein [Thermomicrobiales bacterium]